MQRIVSVLLLFFLISCCYERVDTLDSWNLNEHQVDSITFSSTHHYTRNFNFSVRSDSLYLLIQSPTEYLNGLSVDSIYLYKWDKIVVADIMRITSDTTDSIWVKVARDQQTIGWIRENTLLSGVIPDTPISFFLDFFSNTYLVILLVLFSIFCFLFVLSRSLKLGSKIVFLNDIQSYYPKILCFGVATTAVLYSSIKLFSNDSWLHYYYHPTLNPFSVPFHLSVFLLFVWGLIVLCIATIDDVYKSLRPGEATFYIIGLLTTCFLFYEVFSILTLYYVGYLLYVALFVFCVSYIVNFKKDYFICGKCGGVMLKKGKCPHCGTMNI